MNYNRELIDFIEDNKNLINDNDFQELYRRSKPRGIFRSQLTSLLILSNLNIIRYLKDIPANFFSITKKEYVNDEEYDKVMKEIISSLSINTIKNIKNKAFSHVETDQDLIINNINRIGTFAFFYSSFNNILLNGGKTIGESALQNIFCNNVTIKDFNHIEGYSFTNSHMNNLIITDVNYIDFLSFPGSKVKIIHLYNIEELSTWAFQSCEDIKRIYIHKGVKKIKVSAFDNCNKDLIIYCSDSKRPQGWDEGWDYIDAKEKYKYRVIWGYKGI